MACRPQHVIHFDWWWRIGWLAMAAMVALEEIRALKDMNMGIVGSTEALISLGRYPETGNILDIILFSFPLRDLVGFPLDHNIKVFLILIEMVYAAMHWPGVLPIPFWFLLQLVHAIVNPLVIQDINKLGLRQVVLWWLLLLPIFLQRAGRSCSIRDGFIVGVIFTLIAGFYWFYGLFAGLFGLIWLLWWWRKDRPPSSWLHVGCLRQESQHLSVYFSFYCLISQQEKMTRVQVVLSNYQKLHFS